MKFQLALVSTICLILPQLSNAARTVNPSCYFGLGYNGVDYAREECGWGGITQEQCESKGCCFDSTVPNTKWCFKSDNMPLPVGPPTCSNANPATRTECGWGGISKATCEARGCCWDQNTPNVKWCFNGERPQAEYCSAWDPADRYQCGWPGISEATCLTRGCCWDSTTPNVKWCFHGNIPEQPTCDTSDRHARIECGWPGISESTCRSRACCWDSTHADAKWCFKGTEEEGILVYNYELPVVGK